MSAELSIRATVRLRNDEMISARERLGLSQPALADACQVGVHAVRDLESLKYTNGMKLLESARTIAAYLGLEEETVFPAALRGQQIQSTFVSVKRVPLKAMLAYREAQQKRLTGPAGDMELASEEIQQAIEKAMECLSYREREVIRLRYGIGDDRRSFTLDEVAKIFKVGRERVRQIEARAIRLLQHPARSSTELEQFLDEARP